MTTELEEKPQTAVTVVERAALALGADEHEKELIALSKKYVDITVIQNKAGRDQVHAAAMELGNARVATKKTGEVAREDANAFQKAVIAEANRRMAIVTPEETRLLALRDKWDAEREAEKIAKALAESQRVTAIRQKIEAIKNCVLSAMGRSSGEIESAIIELESTQITLEDWAEYTGEAQATQMATVEKLKAMLDAQIQIEIEQQRMQQEREQLARDRADAEERERVAAAEREAQAKKDAAARAEQEERDRKERQRIAAEQQAAADEAAAVLLAERVAHDALMEAQLEELNRKQAVIDAAIAEQERVAREAREAAEAEERRQREAAEAAERVEAERIQAEKDAAEAERVRLVEAAEAERLRREKVQFELNGPDAVEIVALLAIHYEVEQETALNWLSRHVWSVVEIA